MAGPVAVYQPRYFPRLHYLARVNQSDVFVLLDDVEFSRRSRQHRAEISVGSKNWLTIPVVHEGEDIDINEAIVDTSDRFAKKHYRTLQHKYGSKTELLEPFYEDITDQQELPLVDVTVPTLLELLEQFDVSTEVIRSSELPVAHPGDPSEYLARLVTEVDGSEYISGKKGYRNYLDEAPFERHGLEITVQDWTPAWDDGNVCCLDVLFGAENPANHI